MKVFKKNKGITIVSLVVTIIILIILAGVSISTLFSENGIITMAKKAKENVELAQIEEQTELNELYTKMQTESVDTGEISYDAIAKLAEFKTTIADYIEEAGGIKPNYTADAITFGERIKNIVTEVTKDATATSEDIANGKTAYVNGTKITGTNINEGSLKLHVYPIMLGSSGPGITNADVITITDINKYNQCVITCEGNMGTYISARIYIDGTLIQTISDTISHSITLNNNSELLINFYSYNGLNNGGCGAIVQLSH